ncbi:hypothetical protein BC834DRAFT_900085 [Gloeopeniophorella convolvens]|nr:hypothetical protein BC834DRAFT_900085 [Gloeopeniophorella convolvens]
MANSPLDPVAAQLERQKMTLIASLSSVAEQMRHCANVADQFAQMLTHASLDGIPTSPGGAYGRGKRAAGGDDLEGTTKRRRVAVKKVKDPDAPKRAASSYIFFQNDLRAELRRQHPDISPTEVMARVKRQWSEMTPDQKAPYERLQAEAKQKWAEEKRAYDERRGIVAPEKPGRKAAVAVAEEPVLPIAVSSPDVKSIPEPNASDSSSETGSSTDSKESEEEAEVEKSDEEVEEEDKMVDDSPAPSPLPTKGKAKGASTAAKPKGKISSSVVATPAQKGKKKSQA